jgi:endoglucanase
VPAWLAVLLAACGAPDVAGPDWSEPATPSAAPVRSPPRLHVDGAALRDANGTEVRLRGLNVCSLEFDNAGANWQLDATDGGSVLLDALVDPAKWNANVVRVEQLIDAAALRGMYVLLDVQWEHAERTEPYQLNILKQPTFGFGNTTEAFWHRASGRFGNRDNVLFDVINEPHEVAAEELARVMQKMLDRLAQRAPDTPVIIGGPDWAHSVDFFRAHPLAGKNVIYAAHQYLPYDPPEKFEGNFEQAAERLPVLVAEFGPTDASYTNALIDRAEASGVDGWLGWAIGCDVSVEDFATSAMAERMRALNAP